MLGTEAERILDAVKPSTEDRDCGTVLIVGGGKSAQEYVAVVSPV